MGRFDGAAVWITGGGSGLGRALALELAAQGARVAVSGRRAEALEQTAELAAGEVVPVPVDVTDDPALADARDQVVARLGGLDVAVANAGFAATGRVEDLDAATWRRQLDVNVVAAARTCALALPHIRERRGRLALVGSAAAWLPIPGVSAYVASKAAVWALSEGLRAEVRRDGVSVTLVQPGYVATDVARVDNHNRLREDWKDRRPRWLMADAASYARAVARALHRRRKVLTFTGHGKLGVWAGRHLGGLTRELVSRSS